MSTKKKSKKKHNVIPKVTRSQLRKERDAVQRQLDIVRLENKIARDEATEASQARSASEIALEQMRSERASAVLDREQVEGNYAEVEAERDKALSMRESMRQEKQAEMDFSARLTDSLHRAENEREAWKADAKRYRKALVTIRQARNAREHPGVERLKTLATEALEAQ